MLVETAIKMKNTNQYSLSVKELLTVSMQYDVDMEDLSSLDNTHCVLPTYYIDINYITK